METVYRIRLGFADTWLIKGDHGHLLVDSGPPGKMPLLIKRLSALKIAPADIKLAVATHVHFDHVGNTAQLQSRFGIQTAVGEKEVNLAASGRASLPGGSTPFSRTVVGLGHILPSRVLDRIMSYPAFTPDVVLKDGGNLEKFGFDAKVLSTPGHTDGSMSLVTAEGNAFTGDLCYNDAYFLRKTVRALFCADPQQVRRSFIKLLENGTITVHPGHGPGFDAGLLKKEVRNLAEGK